jgi:hypothetical protein
MPDKDIVRHFVFFWLLCLPNGICFFRVTYDTANLLLPVTCRNLHCLAPLIFLWQPQLVLQHAYQRALFRGHPLKSHFQWWFSTRCSLFSCCSIFHVHFSHTRCMILKRFNRTWNWQFYFDVEIPNPMVASHINITQLSKLWICIILQNNLWALWFSASSSKLFNWIMYSIRQLVHTLPLWLQSLNLIYGTAEVEKSFYATTQCHFLKYAYQI